MLRSDRAVKVRFVETHARYLFPAIKEKWQPHAPIDTVGIPDKRIVANGDSKEEQPARLEQIEELAHRAQVSGGVERVPVPANALPYR